MAFYNGSSTIPGLINLMADKLIASDPKYTNTYSASTRYTGDANDVDYGVTCYQRRVTRWEDPAKSGQEKTMYVVFQIPFWDVNQAMFQYSSTAQYMFGIEVIVSSTWDGTNNVPGADAQRTLVMMATYSGGMSALQKSQLMATNIAYWLWVDDDISSPDKGNGLVIMMKPDQTTWGYPLSCCFNMEKLTSKEFSDGYSLWHFGSFLNAFPNSGGTQNSITKKWAWILHPWALPATDDTLGDANDYFYLNMNWWGKISSGTNTFSDQGMRGIDYPVWAALSQGGSPPNVYFTKGICHAEPRYNNKPIGIIQHCFPWKEGTGIIDQDIISEPSPSTTKYVCLAKESPYSAVKLPMAIKYEY